MLLAHVNYLLCLTAAHSKGLDYLRISKAFVCLAPLCTELVPPGLKYSVHFILNFSSFLQQSLKIYSFMIFRGDTIFVSLYCTMSYKVSCVQSTLHKKGRWFRCQRKLVKATHFTRWLVTNFFSHNHSVAFCIQFPFFILHHTFELGKSTHM
jgi:hypothetical protein